MVLTFIVPYSLETGSYTERGTCHVLARPYVGQQTPAIVSLTLFPPAFVLQVYATATWLLLRVLSS